jgi:hypothetical protein
VSTFGDLGVRGETQAEWESAGFEPLEAALGQGDGFGPLAARHFAAQLHAMSRQWRATGMDDKEALAWHRSGFGPPEAARWRGEGVTPEVAALRAGRRPAG